MAEATFYTIANEPFFPGLLALINSLRLTGHDQKIVVLDRGLTPEQRGRIGSNAALFELPAEEGARPTLFRTYPRLLDPKGVVVILDSDMIVTRSLEDVIARAARGSFCAFPDHSSHTGRWFAEWEHVFELPQQPRHQTYLNGGFVAFSARHFPELLHSWWRRCALASPELLFSGEPQQNPLWAGDQDALNAILMTEVEPERIEVLPAEEEAYPDALLETEVVDEVTLEARYRGHRVAILHNSFAPKTWERSSWLRLRDDAYARLLPRVLLWDDVPVRMSPGELPLWLRPTRTGRAVYRAFDTSHGALRRAVHALPGPARRRALRLRDLFFRKLIR